MAESTFLTCIPASTVVSNSLPDRPKPIGPSQGQIDASRARHAVDAHLSPAGPKPPGKRTLGLYKPLLPKPHSRAGHKLRSELRRPAVEFERQRRAAAVRAAPFSKTLSTWLSRASPARISRSGAHIHISDSFPDAFLSTTAARAATTATQAVLHDKMISKKPVLQTHFAPTSNTLNKTTVTM